jgi:hypothetical protein
VQQTPKTFFPVFFNEAKKRRKFFFSCFVRQKSGDQLVLFFNVSGAIYSFPPAARPIAKTPVATRRPPPPSESPGRSAELLFLLRHQRPSLAGPFVRQRCRCRCCCDRPRKKISTKKSFFVRSYTSCTNLFFWKKEAPQNGTASHKDVCEDIF